MTIRKGEDWGAGAVVPVGFAAVDDDAALLRLINAGTLPDVVAVHRGDLARTVSASTDPTRYRPGSHVIAAPIDLLEVTHDGGTLFAASHVVARRSWWRGEVVVVANAQFIGTWDIAPRSHPNDGFMDVSEVAASMSVGQRVLAVRRLPTATHIPHPGIRTSRIRSGEWRFRRAVNLYLDGVRVARTSDLRIRVVPDALSIFI